jgi:hypothetical protein
MELFMRRAVLLFAVCVTFSGGPAASEIDLRDYDDDLMRTLEKTIKYFEPDLTAKNVRGATEDAEILQDGFKYTEDYFSKKGVEDAVNISRRGQEFVAAAMKHVAEKDFEAASAAAREAIQLCKACHDVYKPRLAR